jgi:hypothetical protein
VSVMRCRDHHGPTMGQWLEHSQPDGQSTTFLPLSSVHCVADKRPTKLSVSRRDQTNMIIPGIVTTGSLAIAKIDVLQVHAAELYVAPAIGEYFDCRCWREQEESVFFGQWADVEHARAMLAAIRSAMDEAFAEFFETDAGSENPKILAARFSEGMGSRISQRLRRMKAGRPASVLARGKDLAAAFVKLVPRTPMKEARSFSATAYAAGVEAGDRVELRSRGA